jgi:photosynthetic reaction center cytochrome c subunit
VPFHRPTAVRNFRFGIAFLFAVIIGVLPTLGQTPPKSSDRKNSLATAWQLPVSSPAGADRCVICHRVEVQGYARSAMAHSLRRAGQEPEGKVTANGSTVTMHSSRDRYWQTWENGGDKTDYRVDYVVGSGNHASGYLVEIGGHLFQSPVAYYRSRQAYDLAPGFENTPNPDFTRPISEECLLCHSGTALHIPGTLNWYRSPPFASEAISCERCHGPVEHHLADPRAGTIVNPAKLEPAARDSICEQCHLFGASRVPNPGKKLSDFVAGQRIEDTFTIYHDVAPEGAPSGEIKVISHVEQLALSACSRNSAGRLWCGTCHDPHDKPQEPVAYYRARCLACHNQAFPASHPGKDTDCLGCHMPRRAAKDGGHSAFTDHRIQRRPQDVANSPAETRIAAWREPAPELARRNLGIAYIDVGTQRRSSPFVVQGYRLLTEVQRQFPEDPDFFKWIGEALLLGRNIPDAKLALERALQLEPDSALTAASVAAPYIQEDDTAMAITHLERAISLDPLYLPGASTLLGLYQKTGKDKEAAELSMKISAAFVQRPLSASEGQRAGTSSSAKNAEEVFKNIQVFQGLPADEVVPAMQFMTASLGVECRFCHVEGHFEKDDKKEKQTARRMLRMVAAINKNSFDGQRQITCYSCHRGVSDPPATTELSSNAGSDARSVESLVSSQGLPTVRQVLSAYVQALGGTAAIRKVSSRVMSGTAQLENRATAVELFTQSPGQYALVRHFPQGDNITVFDGQSGWFAIPGFGVHEMSEAEADFAHMDADTQFATHIEDFFSELRVEYPENLGGRVAYVLVGVLQEDRSVKFFFDEQSGLLLRELRYAESPLGILPLQLDYDDYRELDGVQVPFRMTRTESGSTEILQFAEVRQNVPIEPSKFARPAQTQKATVSRRTLK